MGIHWGTKYYVFTVLPFGLSSAPFIFTKVLRPLVSYWHANGIKICLYLDDGAGIEKTYETAKRNSAFVKETLVRAGMTCNDEKSVWKPTKVLSWVGIKIDLTQNMLFIPEERVNSTLCFVSCLLKSPYTTARKLSKLTGKLLSMKYVIGNIIRLKTRYLYKCIDGRSSWDAHFNILYHREALGEIFFWKHNLERLNKRYIHSYFYPQEYVYSDASSTGLGAVTSGEVQCHRNFSFDEQRKSSTWRELTALFYALKTFQKLLHRKQAVCCVDNFATSRIVEIGSPNSELHSIALKIFDFCQENSVEIRVKWIPRALNTEADLLSKHVDLDDWEISSELFSYLDELWGPFSIDRFADENNRKVLRFNSIFYSPSTEAVDAFSQNWEDENNLFVPPISKIPDVISRISQGKVKGTLVIPYWKSSVFWPLLATQNGLFCYFITGHVIFTNASSLLKAGPCEFSYLHPKRYNGSIIALKIES